MGFYGLHSGRSESRVFLVAIILISLAYSLLIYSPAIPMQSGNWYAMTMILMFFVMFALFVSDSEVLRPLRSVVLARVGTASYSLYLLHESIGVSLINVLNEYVFPTLLWPLVTIVALVLVSIIFYEKIETPSRQVIRRIHQSIVKN